MAYVGELRKNRRLIASEALQNVRAATTIRVRDGRVSQTDGPDAETKEQSGGILVLAARGLNHAIQLMSNHPGIKADRFEIRPAEDLTAMIGESPSRPNAGWRQRGRLQ